MINNRNEIMHFMVGFIIGGLIMPLVTINLISSGNISFDGRFIEEQLLDDFGCDKVVIERFNGDILSYCPIKDDCILNGCVEDDFDFKMHGDVKIDGEFYCKEEYFCITNGCIIE